MTKKILSLMLLGMLCSIGNVWGDSTYEYYHNGTSVVNTKKGETNYFSGTDISTTSGYSTILGTGKFTTSAGEITATKVAKMNSKGSVTFTTTATSTVTIIMISKTKTSDTGKNTVLVGSNESDDFGSTTDDVVMSDEIIFENIAAGTHTITRGGQECGLLYVKVVESAPSNPTLVGTSSSPVAGATGVAATGSGYLKFNKNLSTVTASQITISPNSNSEALSSIAINGSDASKVNFSWSGLQESTLYTINIAAGAVNDGTSGNTATSLSFTSAGRTVLTGAWSPSAPEFIVGSAASAPTFTVTGGTKDTDYSVAYSIQSGTLATVNSSTGITAINTTSAGTATVRATITVLNTTDYKVNTATYDCVITVAEAPTSWDFERTWNFTNDQIKASSEWNNEKKNEAELSNATLTVGGTAIDVTYGLKFTGSATKLALSSGSYVSLAGNDARLIIPNVEVGTRITILAQGAGDAANIIAASDNIAKLSGSAGKSKANHVFQVTSTGDCSFKRDGGSTMYVYSISLIPAVTATIGATGWTTFASSSPLDLSNMVASSGTATAYYVSSASSSVHATSTTATIETGTGILLKGTANATVSIAIAESGSGIEGNKLVGCTTSTSLSANANYYVMVNNNGTAEFQSLVDNGATIPAGKAYLNLSGTSAPGRLLIIEEENNATSVETISSNDEAVKFFENGQLYIKRDGVVYDVTGRVVK